MRANGIKHGCGILAVGDVSNVPGMLAKGATAGLSSSVKHGPRKNTAGQASSGTQRWAAILLLAWLFPCAASALAREPQVIVEMDRNKIYEGESVLYRVTLNHVDNPSPPELAGFDDFSVTSLGEQSLDSRQITIINGRRTEKIRRGRAYNYRLTPRGTGTLTIPAPTAKVDGRVLRGQEMTLSVVAPQDQNIVRMEITVDHDVVYPTQPFKVTLAVAVKGLPAPFSEREPLAVLPSPPALSMPWVDDASLPDGLAPAVTLNQWLGPLQNRRGVGFGVNNISRNSVFSMFEERAAAFRPDMKKVRLPDKQGVETEYWEYRFTREFIPGRVGVYNFGPVTLKGTFATAVSESGKLTGEAIFAVAKSAMVSVKDVPEQGRPDCYIGAIGQFQLSAELTPKKARVGDPITLTLSLSGKGSLEGVTPPDLAEVPGIAEQFKIYEATDDVRRGSCRFTYSLRPLVEGLETFPAVPVAFFDVEKGEYVTLQTEPIPIEVAKADRLSSRQILSGAGGNQRELQLQSEGVFANITDLSAVRNESIRPGLWLASLCGLAVVYLVLRMVLARMQRLSGDQSRVRRRSAAAKARRRMRAATAELKSRDVRHGTVDMQAALLGLVADVADLPEAGLTSKDVERELAELGVEADLTRQVVELLETCDAAQYGVSSSGPDQLPDQARTLLDALIKTFKRKRLLR